MKSTDLNLGPKRLKIKPKSKRDLNELVQTLFRVPWGILERVDQLAEAFGVKRAQMLRAIVEAGVKDLETDSQAREAKLKPAVERARKRHMGAGRGK